MVVISQLDRFIQSGSFGWITEIVRIKMFGSRGFRLLKLGAFDPWETSPSTDVLSPVHTTRSNGPSERPVRTGSVYQPLLCYIWEFCSNVISANFSIGNFALFPGNPSKGLG